MYEWRKMTPSERQEVLSDRRRERLPWHSPPHWNVDGEWIYLVSAACYEHASIIGRDPRRMIECEREVLATCRVHGVIIHAWCVLPNHYHVLLETGDVLPVLADLGKFHGRSSRRWNQEDGCPGRKSWYNATDRAMRSERHFRVSMNYVHHNPVKHGYVKKWKHWPFSSAAAWLESVRREQAEAIWEEYPVLDYGKGWDE